jgi:hypothetical protein
MVGAVCDAAAAAANAVKLPVTFELSGLLHAVWLLAALHIKQQQPQQV